MKSMQDHRIKDHVAYSNFVDDSVRSLDLLSKIESVRLYVGTIRDMLNGFVAPIRSLCESLPSIEGPIPEDGLIGTLESVEQRLEILNASMLKAHRSAKADKQLREEDGVAAVYAEALEALCVLYSEVQDYRWGVMHHNAFLENPSDEIARSASEVESLLASF